MVIYSDEMGTSVSVTTAYVEVAEGKYSPLLSGRLIQVKLNASGDAVTTLIENVTVRLSSAKWGVPVTIALSGNNLRTAPTTAIPISVQNCDLPVETGVELTVEVKNVTGATPVTPRYQIIGVFEG